MNLRAFEAEMTRAAIFWAAVELAAFIIGMYILYLVVKAAVRDGIQESGLIATWKQSVRAKAEQDHAAGLPDMRAD